VPAHRCMLAGPRDEDGHYFAAAFRWPAENTGGGPVITMPEGLSQEATMMLLRLRYGSDEVEADYILEATWKAGKKIIFGCDVFELQALGVLRTYRAPPHEETEMGFHSMPVTSQSCLTGQKYGSAARQWSRVAEAAEAESENPSTPSMLPSSRQSELGTLNRIRHRDGHVCGSLEEYLHVASDDLVAWERSLALDAPQAAKRKLEGAWRHWHQILFEYGHIFGADLAEKLRERTRHRRAQLREERSRQRGQDLRLPAGKVWFE
ncbi:infB, partial [Symbiodinium necroappetens]